jgi:hypothetical protein
VTTSRDCEHGYHAALVAHPPIEADGSVEIDYCCSQCGAIEYTVSYGADAWQRELAHRAEQEAQRRCGTRR